jgi:hypothetical protein
MHDRSDGTRDIFKYKPNFYTRNEKEYKKLGLDYHKFGNDG